MYIRLSRQKSQIKGGGCRQASIFCREKVPIPLRLAERYKGQEKEKILYIFTHGGTYIILLLYIEKHLTWASPLEAKKPEFYQKSSVDS